jgi:hypothetical protein
MSELHTHLSELFQPTHGEGMSGNRENVYSTLTDTRRQLMKPWLIRYGPIYRQAEKYDARLANTLIDDATSVLVFVSNISPIPAFIVMMGIVVRSFRCNGLCLYS